MSVCFVSVPVQGIKGIVTRVKGTVTRVKGAVTRVGDGLIAFPFYV